MDAKQLRSLKPTLAKFLGCFDDCFARKDTRAHLPRYVRGQLSDLPAKSVEPIAHKEGVPPRTLQEFLSLHKWDHQKMRDRLQEIVAREHAGPHRIGVIDETSFAKKGTKTPGVKRQWCGSAGKTENCIVTVHLGYAQGDFHCLLDGELFLPEDWAADSQRRAEAGVPRELDYRPKWRISLELYDRAVANGVGFDWITFDEYYGGKPQFLRELQKRGQRFVGEVPRSFTGWLKLAKVTERPYRSGRGRPRAKRRLCTGSPPAIRVDKMLRYSPALRDQPWTAWRIKDGEQGPVIWEVKHVLFYPKDEDGLPAERPLHLVVARNVRDKSEIKFFVGGAPLETGTGPILLVGFSRGRIERCFEDQKGEVGLDHYEGRRYLGLKRHLILGAVSHLFLARVRKDWRGEKSGMDDPPSAYGDIRVDPALVAGRAGHASPARPDHPRTASDSTTKRQVENQSRSPNPTPPQSPGHTINQDSPLPMGTELAL